MVYLYIPVRTPESFQKEGWLTPVEIYKLDKFLKEQEQKIKRTLILRPLLLCNHIKRRRA